MAKKEGQVGPRGRGREFLRTEKNTGGTSVLAGMFVSGMKRVVSPTRMSPR